jgi:predicted PurR-regulated permease PerM
MRVKSLENRAFLLVVALVTLAFLWTLHGFLLPVFWAVVLTILFSPVYRRIERTLGGRKALASLLTLLAIFLLIVVPITLIGIAVTSEAVGVYQRVASGEIDVQGQIAQVEAMLPRLTRQAAALGVDLDRVREGAGTAALSVSRNLASRLLTAGQGVFTFMLLLVVTFYTLFFFLKDRHKLMDGIVRALPLGDDRERRIFRRFASVTRATVKGTFIVAIVQGALGGAAFALLGLGSPVLWGVVMALMSLVPAVGAAIVWIPAAAFLFATGEVVNGAIMVGVGGGVISMVDNFLRPVLVGQDAGMPDYLILLSTLGGIAAFGISGLVIGPVVAGLFLTVWEIFAEEFGSRDARRPQAEMEKADPATDTPPGPAATPSDGLSAGPAVTGFPG